MVNKKRLSLVIALLLIALLGLGLIGNHVQRRKAQENARQMQQILSYVAERDGEVFDFDSASETLGISRKEMHRHLFQLEQEHKIVAEQQYLRKPILISDSDYANYYWKVYLASDERQQAD